MTRAPMKIIYEPPLRTIMVASGSSFVGSTLCRLLAGDGALRVVSVDFDSTPAALRETGNFRPVAVDRNDRASLASLLAEEQVDTIIDLNAADDASLAESARGHWALLPPTAIQRCRFIAVSTARAGSAELASDLPLVRAVAAEVYGPAQPVDALIASAILRALAGELVWIDGAGLEQRDWLHVDDLAMALLTIVARGRVGARYDISARERHSTLATVATVCDLIDRIAPRPDGRKHRSLIRFRGGAVPVGSVMPLDPTRSERELGWHPQIPFDLGLMEMIDWCRHQSSTDLRPIAASA